jgi:hypothetical protein
MKSLISKNASANCYINIVVKTLATLKYSTDKDPNYENLLINHGLLHLKPIPVDQNVILSQIEQMDNNNEQNSNRYTNVLEIFHYYEFATNNLGLFIDNYDSVCKLLSTESNGNEKTSKFLVQNYVSIGCLVSEKMLEKSLEDKLGNTIVEKLQIMFSKLIVCEPPSLETFSEEGVVINLQHTINEVEIEQDNKFILFADLMKESKDQ